MKKNFIRVPYGMSVHGKDEIKAVNYVLKTSTQMGKKVEEFESKIAKLFDKKYGLMTNSGSSAILLAMESLEIPNGSEIITPVLTFSTTVSSLLKGGYKPIFVDIKENTYCIDVNKIENKITKKTKAILAPDLLGNICEWDKIKKIAKKYKLMILHDSADTLGSKLNKKNVGYYTDISITSFYGSHIINGAGNGGMLCVNDTKIYKKAKLLRSWGRSSSLMTNSEDEKNRFKTKIDNFFYDRKFLFEESGYQLEPSEISAAFGLVQLKKLFKFKKHRQLIFKKHLEFFKKYDDFFELPLENPNSSTAWLAFPIIVKKNNKFTRTDLQIFLEKRNIQTRVIFTGNILKQPGFRFLNKKNKKSSFKFSDFVMENGLLIGLHQGLNKLQINHIHSSINMFLKKFI